MRMFAARGAVDTENTAEDIVQNSKELLEKLLLKNNIKEEEIVSIIFSATPDLNKAFPARAARQMNLDVPLFCTQEMDVEDAPTQLIRVLVHYQKESANKPESIYIGRARQLRPDLNLKPEEIYSSLLALIREREEKMGAAVSLKHSPITTQMLAKRALGKNFTDPLSKAEEELFLRSAQSLQMQGRIGCLAKGGLRDWFVIGTNLAL